MKRVICGVIIILMLTGCNKQDKPNPDIDILVNNLVLINYSSNYRERLKNVESEIPIKAQVTILTDIERIQPTLEILGTEYEPKYKLYSVDKQISETSVLVRVTYREVELLQQPMTTLIYLEYKKGVVIDAKVLDLFNNFNHTIEWLQ